MKASIFDQHGEFKHLVYREVPDPVPQEGEVVVRVKACSINHLDIWVLKGSPAYPVALPHVLGNDVAGTIESLGAGVKHIRVGDRVVVSPVLNCGTCRFCLAGRENICETISILGAKAWGGFAERVKVPAANLIALPEKVAFETAAALPVAYMTAWHMLKRAMVGPGKHVLVAGASSGVGSAAVQLAKIHGAKVLATVTSDEKGKLARALGADAVVNSTQDSIAHVARAWTDKRGVDIAIEPVGPATWDQSLGSLSAGGILVTCGTSTGPDIKLDLRYVFSRELSILGNRVGTHQDLQEVVTWTAEGKLKPPIAKQFPLSEAAAALQFMEDRKHFGKIILIS